MPSENRVKESNCRDEVKCEIKIWSQDCDEPVIIRHNICQIVADCDSPVTITGKI